MAESSWPSPSNGRVVDDTQYEKLGIAYGLTAGVIGDFTSPQLVYGDSTGMQIKVTADRYALVRGHVWYSGPTIVTKTIGSNSSGSTRTDLVVLRLSRTTWDVTVVVIAGTPGAGAPSPTQNTGTTGSFDLPLATVTVANGAATISAGNVTYVGTHLDGAGGLRVPSVAALSYVPLPVAGLKAALNDGTQYSYSGSAWLVTAASAWSSYTPAWTATGTAPNLGNATVTGRYLQIGKTVHLSVRILFGTTSTFGTGAYSFSLPVAASASGGGRTGSAYCRDTSATSAGHFQGNCVIDPGISTTTLYVINVNAQVGATTPFTWANTDHISFTITYEAA